ncbi:PdxA family protein [Geomicrobium sp. JSM 1781026]|uniref:PdxA family dehydrogenase n=1 Tax=Geomicrobium sp. JSM 1781026 TaxID=3344580 RepID=UPI0035BFC12B
MNERIGITLGDAAGIGPELVVKAFQHQEIREKATWIVAGDRAVLERAEAITGKHLNVTFIQDIHDAKTKAGTIYFIEVATLGDESYKLGELSPDAGKAAGECLKYLIRIAKEGVISSIMYAPLNKEALHRGGHEFKDELHFFATLFGVTTGFSEINKMDDLWVTRVTSHVSLKEVSDLVTKEKVAWTIRFANETLEKAGYSNPRIAVAALNPHAGDGGMLGQEEIEVIQPEVDRAKSEGLNIRGAYPADTLFVRRKKDPFDCLVAMYHDQAQTGMKLLGFNKGVTISGGLPVPLTTPAHGTAFDIAGKGEADEGATIEALKMAVQL